MMLLVTENFVVYCRSATTISLCPQSVNVAQWYSDSGSFGPKQLLKKINGTFFFVDMVEIFNFYC